MVKVIKLFIIFELVRFGLKLLSVLALVSLAYQYIK